ncbi:MAG: substrate-binding domain-containing protein [Luteolibacter sp.]
MEQENLVLCFKSRQKFHDCAEIRVAHAFQVTRTNEKNRTPIRNIGLMLEPLSGYASGILEGISRFVQRKPDWRIAYFDRERKELAELLATWEGDAIICTVVDPRFHEAALGRRIPIINVAGLIDEMEIPTVLSDDEAIGRMAAEHFIGRGFNEFAFLSRRDGGQYANDRGTGFRKRISEVGGTFRPLTISMSGGDAELREKLAKLPRPLALFASLDRLGAMAIEACWKAGYEVPGEIAVLGAGNHSQLCELCSPSLSSVEADMVRRGYEAAALLDRILAGEAPPREPVRVPPAHVMERKSTDAYAFGDEDVVAALRFIREHAHQTIKGRDVVAATKLSRRSLEGRFNTLVGRTLHEEIWRVHFDLAKRLLSSSDLDLQEVAERSGFRSASALVNLFRQRLGVTPRTFRLTNRR